MYATNPFRQILFNWILARLRDQGWRKAVDARGVGCVYETDDGEGCAVGVCIPARLRAEANRYGTIGELLVKMGGLPSFLHVHDDFLNDMQEWHDHGLGRRVSANGAFSVLLRRWNVTVPAYAVPPEGGA